MNWTAESSEIKGFMLIFPASFLLRTHSQEQMVKYRTAIDDHL